MYNEGARFGRLHCGLAGAHVSIIVQRVKFNTMSLLQTSIMKKFKVLAAFLLITMTACCQDDSEKDFTFSIRTGVAFWLDGVYLELGIQGEYRISDHFSVYIPVQYHPELSSGIRPGTLGVLAGPRYYANDRFFAGIGAGYAYYIEYSQGGFAYQPQIGLDRPRTQWTLGYYSGPVGFEVGYIDLKVAFKLDGRN